MAGGGGLLFAILDWELTKHFLIEEKFKSQEDTIHKWVFKDHIFWGQENKKRWKFMIEAGIDLMSMKHCHANV